MPSANSPFNALPLRRVEEYPRERLDRGAWPATLAPVRQLLDDGLELGPMTILVGDNGSGKSTLVEAVAMAFGMNAEGGSTNTMNRTFHSESNLADHLQLVRGGGASRRGFFLRAETMHGLFTYLESIGDTGSFHQRSHGESFLDLVVARSQTQGLWILDEPESALSLPGCLALIGLLHDLVDGGSQVLLSTHSPVLAAYPNADLYEIGDWGIRACEYDDLDLVRNWRAFLDAPERFLRHITSVVPQGVPSAGGFWIIGRNSREVVSVNIVSKVQRGILLLALAVVLWLLGCALILFAEELVVRIVGVVSFAAAVPVAIAGGRGLRDRQ